MSLTTLPRQVLALEYRALRLPTRLLQTQVVARYLDDTNPSRLGFERALGVVDGYAGRLLRDEPLAARGAALRRRVELLESAETLSTQARAQRRESRQELHERKAQACEERQQAVADEREQTEHARAEAAKAKAKASQRAEEEQRTAAERAEEARKRTVEAARSAAEVRTSVIEQRTERATAGAKAQLRQADATKAEAGQKREDAATLAALSARERRSRKAT